MQAGLTGGTRTCVSAITRPSHNSELNAASTATANLDAMAVSLIRKLANSE
jgi:hypothetical protein